MFDCESDRRSSFLRQNFFLKALEVQVPERRRFVSPPKTPPNPLIRFLA